jgi:hypothetical protein
VNLENYVETSLSAIDTMICGHQREQSPGLVPFLMDGGVLIWNYSSRAAKYGAAVIRDTVTSMTRKGRRLT